MTHRWWYLRRAIPWVALLGCCGAAVVAAVALHRWPSTATALLPAMLGCCAAAAAFVFDERETAVATVTPRSWWRRLARAGVGLVPLALWTLLVALPPDDVPLERGGWWLAGAAAILATVGAAAVATRRELPSPGTTLSASVAVIVFGPLVTSAVLGWATVYPVGEFPSGVLAFWAVLGGAGLAACVVALRPGLRS